MSVNKKYSVIALFLAVIAAAIFIKLNFATDQAVLRELNKLPQNALFYIKSHKNPQLDPKIQENFTHQFLIRYFSPWKNPPSQNRIAEIKEDALDQIQKFQENPGIGPNYHRYGRFWIKQLVTNMDMGHFPNFNQNAITIRDSNIRILPSEEPSFTNLGSVSKGYPFDNLQQTFVPAGTPLHIVQASKDKGWYLVYGCSYSGWIANKDIAFVNEAFTKMWQTGNYAIGTQDNIPLFNKEHHLATKTRIGVLYPVTQTTPTHYVILAPTMDTSGEAIAKPISVSKDLLSQFPLPLSERSIAQIANNLMGKPYGWGGIYGYRDCSATTKDLMATFGIWLPRNSSGQAVGGQTLSLRGLSDNDKEQVILQKAIPYLTLVHTPGHIMLYVGQKEGKALVFHDMWGLHVYPIFNDKDRIIVGRTVITPLGFGKNFVNVSSNHLTEADSITNLLPSSSKS